jgi:diadenosine tetraphosphatase ApaH/serine/threonine PP2A family protein phosphatase
MKLAILADVHANLEALTACLDHARAAGAEAFAFVGDLVGYGADPAAVLDVVRSHAESGAVVVRGNHDAAVVSPGGETMHRVAEEAIAWTRTRLDERHQAFLASLPLLVRRGDLVFVHASADRPADWTYVTDPLHAAASLRAAGTHYVFSGHVHEPVLYYTALAERPIAFQPVPGVAIPVPPRRQWLAIVGSCGQPRDGNTAACYALLDLERERLAFQRVPYDWATAAAKIRAAGLPERLAARLERGE